MKLRLCLGLSVVAVALQTAFAAGTYQYIIDPGPARTGGFAAPSAGVALSAASRGIAPSAADVLSARFRTFALSAGCNLNSAPARGAVLIVR